MGWCFDVFENWNQFCGTHGTFLYLITYFMIMLICCNRFTPLALIEGFFNFWNFFCETRKVGWCLALKVPGMIPIHNLSPLYI